MEREREREREREYITSIKRCCIFSLTMIYVEKTYLILLRVAICDQRLGKSKSIHKVQVLIEHKQIVRY